ncbi:putative enzyme related to lactoylglutathione lyase [Crossiella equi]|uniref:Enzyme related to lactoylglutathione lyase n=1 Tax=Crossiella equi TaxID=130796 RepID=A0ABS5ALD3_9PSEU|nr:VOC family protein [Crossiella equi]MBP2477077.1 putative enzyme related to lactoylglutathione lyase [Crossiella equi]
MHHHAPFDPAGGTPCWVDVASADPAACRAFYSGLFGWEFGPEVAGHSQASLGGEPVATVYLARRNPGHFLGWTLYLEVSDAERAAKQIVELGGVVLSGPVRVPGRGRLVVAKDPTGGTIGFWETEHGWHCATGRPGTLTWAELNSRDGVRADGFFASLFDFRQDQVGDGHGFDYTTWFRNGEPILGRMRMGPEFPHEVPSHWSVYFGVDPGEGTDALALRAVRLGGKISYEPFDSPFGRLAILEDPTGGTFTVVDTSRRSESTSPVDDPYDD